MSVLPMPLVVFRPIRLPACGFLYGWIISKDTICIVDALTSSSREHAADVLAKTLSDFHYNAFPGHGQEPRILGYIEQNSKLVLDHDVQSVETWLFIEYCPPNTGRIQFFSLEPLKLDITHQSSNLTGRTRLLQQYIDLVEPREGPQTSLSFSLKYLNKAHELRRIIMKRHWNSQPVSFWASSRTARLKRLTNWISKIQYKAASHTIRPLFYPSGLVWSKPIRNSSAFVQQLDVRKDLLLFVLEQLWATEKRGTDSLHFIAVQYISLYNCIWLTLNDIIIGAACGAYLTENHKLLSSLLYMVMNKAIIIHVRNVLVWLDNWPAGLKLNTDLSRALFHSFIQITHIMEVVLDLIAPYFPALLRFTGLMGRFGLTMSIALFSDYLSILTGHLYVLHLVTTLMFSRLKSFSGSLLNLFRGKRFNVLRQRNDFWDYDVDQLLLGTILITLITFLFPTVLLYYVLFALLRFAIMILHFVLDTCLAFMNHFPLFALMLRIKEPLRIPGGIQFTIAAKSNSLVIQNQAISLSRIFFQHLVIWSRLYSHYHPLRLLACIWTGIPMTQLARENIRFDLISRKANL